MLCRRRWIAVVAGIGATALARSVSAQFGFRRQTSPLQSQLRFLQFRVAMGRIEVSTDDPIRNFTQTTKQGDTSERLAIEFAPNSLSLDYTQSNPQGDSSIRVVDSREVILRQNPAPGQKRQPVLFVQPAEGLIQLIVGSGAEAREVQAQSLWQIALGEPEIFRSAIVPLLQVLRPTWPVAANADAIESLLFTTHMPLVAVNESTIARLVDGLGSDAFAERETAERQLAAIGSAVVPRLRRLDLARLDPEQRARVRRIVDTLGDAEAEDTPSGVIHWLLVDPQTWLLLLTRDDVKLRQLAVERLSKLLNRPLAFDPAADAETRQRQWSALVKELPMVQ